MLSPGTDMDAVCLSADGRYALSRSNDKTLRLWDLSAGACVRTLTGHNESCEMRLSERGRPVCAVGQQ